MSFVPKGYHPPQLLETPDFRIRPITIHDVVKDYDAVMSSREYLWKRFGKIWGWPTADLSLEQDLIDLAWHQKEAQLNSSYNYAVMSPNEDRLLGCVYLDPPENPLNDVDIWYWIRFIEHQKALEEKLGIAIRNWIAKEWIFTKPLFH